MHQRCCSQEPGNPRRKDEGAESRQKIQLGSFGLGGGDMGVVIQDWCMSMFGIRPVRLAVAVGTESSADFRVGEGQEKSISFRTTNKY